MWHILLWRFCLPKLLLLFVPSNFLKNFVDLKVCIKQYQLLVRGNRCGGLNLVWNILIEYQIVCHLLSFVRNLEHICCHRVYQHACSHTGSICRRHIHKKSKHPVFPPQVTLPDFLQQNRLHALCAVAINQSTAFA